MAGLAPSHGVGDDGDAVDAGGASAPSPDPAVIERYGHLGTAEPFFATAGSHLGGGTTTEGGTPSETSSRYRLRLQEAALREGGRMSNLTK